jgi:DNA polymerase III psi subunit
LQKSSKAFDVLKAGHVEKSVKVSKNARILIVAENSRPFDNPIVDDVANAVDVSNDAHVSKVTDDLKVGNEMNVNEINLDYFTQKKDFCYFILLVVPTTFI